MNTRSELTVMFPVYNEAESIRQVITAWEDMVSHTGIRYSIQCWEDGSTDATKHVLQHIAKRDRTVSVHSSDVRKGYGAALRDALVGSTTPYVLCLDSDGSYDPNDFQSLWEKRTHADIVVGRRVHRKDPWYRNLFSFVFSMYFRALFPTRLRDPSSSFVLLNRHAVKTILPYVGGVSEGFWWAVSGTAVKTHLRVAEVPIRHTPRFSGRSRVFNLRALPMIILRNAAGLYRLRHA